MKNRFYYILNKLKKAKFKYIPFKHIEINNLFKLKDFKDIINSKEIDFPKKIDSKTLINYLFENGYKSINFPGSVTSTSAYLNWRKNKKKQKYNNSSCEGFGMTFRLKRAETGIIVDLMEFLASKEFQKTLSMKFNIKLKEVTYDQGIQKYLDGYEISPHPDLRKKALTFMVNINPSKNSEYNNHHTHYMKFKKKYKYIQNFWEFNKDKDRCWVPWDWCETVKKQCRNNSIVIFAPNDDTLHAVKADYNHLKYQRTQLYGNLWFKELIKKISMIKSQPEWEQFVINNKSQIADNSLRKQLSRITSGRVKNSIIKLIGENVYKKIKHF